MGGQATAKAALPAALWEAKGIMTKDINSIIFDQRSPQLLEVDFLGWAQTDKHTNRQPDRQTDMATLDQLSPEGPVGENSRRLTDFI